MITYACNLANPLASKLTNWPGDFLNRIICGDCIEVLKKIPDKSVDLIVTDPPYNVGEQFPNDNLQKEEYLQFMENWLKEAHRVLKDNSSLYMFHCQMRMWDVKPILDKFDWEYLNLIIWYYPNWITKVNARKVWHMSYQVIFHYGKNFKRDLVARFYELGINENNDVWTFLRPQRNLKDNYRYHPASKPVDLISKIIAVSTNPGDIVLDPFAGAGATAVAAYALNRHFIAIEIMEDFCKLAQERLRLMGQKLPFSLFGNEQV